MKINKVWAAFWSATTTTEKVVRKIAGTIAEELGVEKDEFDFTLPAARKGVKSFGEGDLVIFGTPVYAGRVPNLLLKYLVTIEGNGAFGVPIVLFGNRNFDDALIELRDIMEEDGFHTIAAGAFVGEHSFSKILGANRPDEKDLGIAEDFAKKVAKTVKTVEAEGIPAPIEVEGVPKPYRGYYQPRDRKGVAIDIRKVKPLTNSDCINCGLCASVCPMGSINPENVSEVPGICIKCCSCVKKCPMQAKYYEDAGYLYHQHELEDMYQRRAEPSLFVNL